MDNFFERVESREWPWPAGREDLHWHILPPGDWTRRHLTSLYGSVTSQVGLEPVAPQWCHMTVLHGPPIEDVSAEQLDAHVERVRAGVADMLPIRLTVDRPTVGNVALECAARPGAPVRALWEITRRAVAETFGEDAPTLPTLHYPHISVAYAGRAAHLADRTRLKGLLADIPGEPAELAVDRLHLVAQRHDGRSITWRHIAEVPL